MRAMVARSETSVGIFGDAVRCLEDVLEALGGVALAASASRDAVLLEVAGALARGRRCDGSLEDCAMVLLETATAHDSGKLRSRVFYAQLHCTKPPAYGGGVATSEVYFIAFYDAAFMMSAQRHLDISARFRLGCRPTEDRLPNQGYSSKYY